jgi:hypothetical protein
MTPGEPLQRHHQRRHLPQHSHRKRQGIHQLAALLGDIALEQRPDLGGDGEKTVVERHADLVLVSHHLRESQLDDLRLLGGHGGLRWKASALVWA